MEWLLLIPVMAAAIGLYAWFRPAAGAAEWPETAAQTESGGTAAPAPRTERDKTAAVAFLHAADQESHPASLAGKAVRWR